MTWLLVIYVLTGKPEDPAIADRFETRAECVAAMTEAVIYGDAAYQFGLRHHLHPRRVGLQCEQQEIRS